jgi:hypothetical protein
MFCVLFVSYHVYLYLRRMYFSIRKDEIVIVWCSHKVPDVLCDTYQWCDESETSN